MSAPRKPLPSQGPSSHIVDMLRSPQTASAPAQRKSRPDGSPTWHQEHPVFRYELTSPDVYSLVAGVATALKVNNISSVASTLMDFALTMYEQGKVAMTAQVNPNHASAHMTLTWERAEGWSQEVKPDRNRAKRRNLVSAPRERKASGWFRWPRETHQRIKALATEYDVPMGAIVTRLLEYAIDEYRAGHLKINVQMVATRDISGWSPK